jgi:hypothetical protein
MKTETIRGKELVRVDADETCLVSGHPIRCALFDEECSGTPDGPPCKNRSIFIRPDQLNDYLAIKLVS